MPGILVRLVADHVLLFWLKRPAAQVAAGICRGRPAVGFHRPDEAELRAAASLYRLSSCVLRYGFLTSRPCLRRSLLLLRWCRKRRIEADLVIGVERAGQGLQGHSWIELDGRPLVETADALGRYTAMLKICSATGALVQAGRERGISDCEDRL